MTENTAEALKTPQKTIPIKIVRECPETEIGPENPRESVEDQARRLGWTRSPNAWITAVMKTAGETTTADRAVYLLALRQIMLAEHPDQVAPASRRLTGRYIAFIHGEEFHPKRYELILAKLARLGYLLRIQGQRKRYVYAVTDKIEVLARFQQVDEKTLHTISQALPRNLVEYRPNGRQWSAARSSNGAPRAPASKGDRKGISSVAGAKQRTDRAPAVPIPSESPRTDPPPDPQRGKPPVGTRPETAARRPIPEMGMWLPGAGYQATNRARLKFTKRRRQEIAMDEQKLERLRSRLASAEQKAQAIKDGRETDDTDKLKAQFLGAKKDQDDDQDDDS